MDHLPVAVVLLCLCAVHQVDNLQRGKTRIAIVGGGIGGTSTAYYLRQLLGSEVDLDLYSSGDIGGRLANIAVAGQEYEVGASIIHPGNAYMVNFTALLGLKKREGSRPINNIFAVYNGKSFDYYGSDWSVVNLGKLIWHYGMDILKIQTYIADLMSNFNRIYSLQDSGYAFTKVEGLLAAMSPKFPSMLGYSIAEEFSKQGFSQNFVNELVQGGLLSNYGQSTDVHAFVGAVSMAGVQPGLWSVQGGNRQVPKQLLDYTKVNVFPGKVTEVSLRSEEGQMEYDLEAVGSNGKDIYEGTYNYLIIATPLNEGMSGIKFSNFPHAIGQFTQPYHRTVATMVQGTPNYKNFGLESANEFPGALLLSNKNLFYNSIGRHTPVDETCCDFVYKVFSKQPLTDDQLGELFESHNKVGVKDWTGAYPHYGDDDNAAQFVLHEGMYYVNAMERAASAMEMSVIGGRNAALLLYNQLHNNHHFTDAPTQTNAKQEL